MVVYSFCRVQLSRLVFVSLFLDSPSLSSFLSSSRSLTFWCLIPSRLPLPSHSSRCLLFSVAPHHLLHYFRTPLSLHSAVLLIQSLYFSMDQVLFKVSGLFSFLSRFLSASPSLFCYKVVLPCVLLDSFRQSRVILINPCRLGATMGPIGLWASGWLYPKSVIKAPAATTPFSVVSLSTFPVSTTIIVMGQGR